MKSTLLDLRFGRILVVGTMLALPFAQAWAQRSPILTDSSGSPTISAPVVQPSTPPTQALTRRDTQQAIAPTRVVDPSPVATVQANQLAPAPDVKRPGSAAAIMRAQWQTKEDGDDLGRGTRSLLALQVSGAAAGPALPMLGATVDVSYRRYLESFGHPIPEFFQAKVPTNQGS